MKKLKICLTGIQGTGKTSLVKELEKYNNQFHFFTSIGYPNVKFYTNYISSEVSKKFPLNLETSDETQFLIFSHYLKHLLMEDQFIEDRGIVDVFLYTKLAVDHDVSPEPPFHKVTHELYSYMEKAISMYFSEYTKIFYFPNFLEESVKDNKETRNVDKVYLSKCKSLFDTYMYKFYQQYPGKIVYITEKDFQKRLEIIVQNIL